MSSIGLVGALKWLCGADVVSGRAVSVGLTPVGRAEGDLPSFSPALAIGVLLNTLSGRPAGALAAYRGR